MDHPVNGRVCKAVRLAFLFVLGESLGWLQAASGDVRAAPAGSTRVTVRCTRPSFVAGLPLRVLSSDPLRKELLPVDERSRFNAKGEAVVDLAPGKYVFEAAADRDDGTIIVVQSDAVSVPEATSAVVNASGPHELQLSHQGVRLRLTEVGVRSAAAVGQTRWVRKARGAVPRLVLTPGKRSLVNVIGNSSSVYVAAWVGVTVKDQASAIPIHPEDEWSDCRFVRRDGTPATRSVTAILHFPECSLEIPITGKQHFLTNRRFLLMAYRMELRDGTCLDFRPLPYNVDREQQFEFGGANLSPRAWAEFIWEDAGANWLAHLVCGVDLLDPSGHRLNLQAPKCGAVATIRRTDGQPVPVGSVADEERKKIGNLADGIRVKVDWVWNGSQSRELAPEGWVPLKSEHFKFASVTAWQWESANYLSKLERYYRVLRSATGRPGPASILVGWRHNTHNAKAMVGSAGGGQQWLWSSFPFGGYDCNSDPFNEPQFLGHELLHTFGYHHGDEMTRLQQLVEFKFALYRWYMLDHPETPLEIVQGTRQGDPAGPAPKK